MTKKELILACQNLLREYHKIHRDFTGIDIDFDNGNIDGTLYAIMPNTIEKFMDQKWVTVDLKNIEN